MNIINIKENPYFILAVLNSRAVSFWFQHKFGKLTRSIFPQFKLNELKRFPIPKASKQEENNLEKLSKNMIDSVKKLDEVKFASDKKFLKQRIELLDKKIDSIVYHLYGLSEDEVKIIDTLKHR